MRKTLADIKEQDTDKHRWRGFSSGSVADATPHFASFVHIRGNLCPSNVSDISNYSGIPVGARGAAGEMLQIPFRYFCRTSCPYWVGTEGLNSYRYYLHTGGIILYRSDFANGRNGAGRIPDVVAIRPETNSLVLRLSSIVDQPPSSIVRKSRGDDRIPLQRSDSSTWAIRGSRQPLLLRSPRIDHNREEINMNAIRIHENGGPDVMQYEEVATPEPAADEVQVRLEASGVNFIDIYHRRGLYPGDLPAGLGMEGAGTVTAVGADVTTVQEGDRVAYAMARGSYAEYMTVPAWMAVPVREGVSTEEAAAVMLQGMTAHYLSHSTYPLQEGDTALIHAAAGGVGLLLVQLAKRRGARVLGTVSTEEKERLARGAGADEVIRYTETDFEAEVKRLTEGGGVDVVYDSVGKDTFEKGLNCLRPRGYMVLYGQSSGPVEPFDLQVLNAKGSLFVTRPSLGHYAADRAELMARATDLFEWMAAGELDVRIDTTFPLADAPAAHHYMEDRKSKGKVLLIP
jgi:NADPH2:quinone reductase